MTMSFQIYRLGPYKHETREDNFAIIAAEGHLEAQDLLESRIELLFQERRLENNYQLLGRIDATGYSSDKKGVLYMTLPTIDDVDQRRVLGQLPDPDARYRYK
tara:strand:- start:6549 stop:6857 length:309 start_codon:yes stop_codon:yes gene_type:complete